MQDVLLNTEYDLAIENGDFVVGFSDKQHQSLLLLTEKGGFKQFPDLGVGLYTQLENEDPAATVSEIRRQFAADGISIKELKIKADGKLAIDASY